MLLGLLLQYLRTGDRLWFRLADELARHVMDIDVYHTLEDKAAYSGGLFWFTDHYLTAHTATHRTYSKRNVPPSGAYGGGPGAEHNYSEGLLLYHCLTGCPFAREAVIGLADWVVRMEDGRLTLLGIVDDGFTGSATVGHAKPSRGGGNSISVLVDGWSLTQDAKYLTLCEELIRRCVHPEDDIERLDLLDAERNWSYTMFLSSLAKYLSAKEEYNAIDDSYFYARASLLHYAEWMLANEQPYLDHAERLEYPTEAWAAQEFRKANVLRRAARYADGALAAELRSKADALGDRAWTDLMSFEKTRATIRSLALVMTEGLADCVLREPLPAAPVPAMRRPNFSDRQEFVGQKARVLAMGRSPSGMLRLSRRLASPRRWLRWAQARRSMRALGASPW